ARRRRRHRPLHPLRRAQHHLPPTYEIASRKRHGRRHRPRRGHHSRSRHSRPQASRHRPNLSPRHFHAGHCRVHSPANGATKLIPARTPSATRAFFFNPLYPSLIKITHDAAASRPPLGPQATTKNPPKTKKPPAASSNF